MVNVLLVLPLGIAVVLEVLLLDAQIQVVTLVVHALKRVVKLGLNVALMAPIPT